MVRCTAAAATLEDRAAAIMVIANSNISGDTL
jgi:hypothetical protein